MIWIAASSTEPLTEGAHNPLDQMDGSIGPMDDIDESFIEILANMEDDSVASAELQATPMRHGKLSETELEKAFDNICSSLPKANEI